MLAKTKALVLKSNPYSESSVVVKMYTSEFGLQTYIINGVRSSKGAIRPSHILPLNLLDLVVYHKPNGGIQRIKELRCQILLNDLNTEMLKRAVAVFMVEALSNVLQTEEAESGLYQFLESSVCWLEHNRSNLALFPHFFLIHLSKYLGAYPQTQQQEDALIFDLEVGAFTKESEAGLQRMSIQSTNLLKRLLHCKADELAAIRVTRTVRQQLMKDLILYYQLHELLHGPIKSHLILNELFDGV